MPHLCLGCRLVSPTTLFTRQLSILKRRLPIALFTHYRSTPLSLNYRSGHHPICPAIAQAVVALPLHPLLTQIASSSHRYSSHVLYHLWFGCHQSNCHPICSPTAIAQVTLSSLKSLPYSLTLSSVVPPSSCIIGCPLHSQAATQIPSSCHHRRYLVSGLFLPSELYLFLLYRAAFQSLSNSCFHLLLLVELS